MSDAPAEKYIHEPCGGCGELLDVTNLGPFEAAICPICSTETHVKREFGAYRLDQRYAIGGMSVIFVGWDTTLDRKVAIKVLNEEYCNDEIRIQAFENEGRLTAQVSHPNVVKVYALGRAYGRFYLVMELLEGLSFERIMAQRGALPEDEVLDIAIQVAAGLRAAKQSGMIPRDVKPANILIDSEGRARLIDFGLALITKDGRAQAEEIWATPYYVPPEALERGIEDFRSDIYAFGATLYQALAGRPAFESTSTSNSVLRRAKQTIPRLCKVANWVTPITGEVVDRMMAYKPEHRWGSYKDVMKALEQAKRSTGGAAPVRPTHSEVRRKRRKSGIGFGTVFSLTLIALGAGAFLWKPWEKIENNRANGPESIINDTPKKTFNPIGSADQKTAQAWQSARDLIASKDFEKAGESFLAISTDDSLPRMSRAWASFEGSISASLDGRPGEARKLVTQTLSDLKPVKNNTPIVLELRRMGKVLRNIPPPLKSDIPQNPDSIAEYLGSFALALKQWEQGQWEAALPTFAKVRSISLSPEYKWFQRYQTLADVYLADGQVLASLKNLPEVKDANVASENIRKIAAAAQQLRTKGRALYNLRARQIYLARLRKKFQQDPAVTESVSWNDVHPILVTHGKALRLAKITAILDNPPTHAPADAVWAWRYLEKKAGRFIKDLSSQTDWAAEKNDGTEITPASGNSQGVTLDSGEFIPWTNLKPERLIKEHSGEEAAEIAFAWLMEKTALANELAEEFSEENADFQRNWKRVIVGTSQ